MLIICNLFLGNKKFHFYLQLQRLVLLNHSQFYQGWENPPIPIYSKFYIFNITNYNRIFGGVKPVLQQVGPFVFRKTISRQILGYNDDHEELSFITSNSYHFVPEKSDMKAFDSKIYTVNIPMAVSILFYLFFVFIRYH